MYLYTTLTEYDKRSIQIACNGHSYWPLKIFNIHTTIMILQCVTQIPNLFQTCSPSSQTVMLQPNSFCSITPVISLFTLILYSRWQRSPLFAFTISDPICAFISLIDC